MRKHMVISVMLLAISLAFLTGCGQHTSTVASETSSPVAEPTETPHVMTWQEQYDFGIRYLSEGNYQEAILAFTAAIEIDPMHPDPYIGLYEAYVAIGDYESAQLSIVSGQKNCSDRTEFDHAQDELNELLSADSPITVSPNEYLDESDISNLEHTYKCITEGQYTELISMVWPDPNERTVAFRLSDLYEKIGGFVIYDGTDFAIGETGTGLMIRKNSVWYGTFENGLPQGECVLLGGLSGGGQPTSYVRVSGFFIDGKLNGYGEVCTVYHDYGEDYNAWHIVCNTWENDAAVGEVEYHYYFDSRTPSIARFSTNQDGTYNFQDPRFVKRSENLDLYEVVTDDSVTVNFWQGDGYETGVYNHYAVYGDSGMWGRY